MKDGPAGTALAFSLEVVELGFDEDGQVITSCVVNHEETSTSTQGQDKRRS